MTRKARMTRPTLNPVIFWPSRTCVTSTVASLIISPRFLLWREPNPDYKIAKCGAVAGRSSGTWPTPQPCCRRAVGRHADVRHPLDAPEQRVRFRAAVAHPARFNAFAREWCIEFLGPPLKPVL